ncbi:membrane-bound PQQ-dependent dehydrogenase, glucose/quinate/shikimate family [Xinfangfangia sp. D13-10-4-6]|uniref:membrane-bound PQQ-dependent dehydrogenase, glucose/quinate/shikimate family n=1 Tax=Pseudogemmobacter hezensis TaxID=2737662 RepID=UPI00155388D3|nr:membrane-bound PQQ-dependent dehydrogenase, glucose/quinate/shikimate family [Pseudogemmobacter hezensis]NPD14900.1 membrane-bound PQQ-dependent dehydrogenase, glucose/quinate/shikimate family [Pseudogemmobacter hezensis]
MSETTQRQGTGGRAAKVFAVLLVLIGAAYIWGGGQLAALGGSLYFLLTGIAVVLSGLLVWRGNALGGWLYALVLASTWIWAISEVGVDFWTLLPRLMGPFLFGLFFLTPWYRRSVTSGPVSLAGGRAVAGALTAAIAGLFVWGGLAGDPHETKAARALPQALGSFAPPGVKGEWHNYGNDTGGTRFSNLTQITPANVKGLEVAWTYRTGDYPPAEGPNRRFQATPLKIGNALYFCTPRNDIVSLNPETGAENWRFNANVNLRGVTGSAACRGVAYFETPSPDTTQRNSAGEALCARRIIGPTVDARLLAVDAATGEPCTGFGENGQVNLLKGLGEVIPGYSYVSSAPQVIRGRVVIGGWVSDGQSVNEPSGVIRAFDATTGAFSWAFDMGDINNHTEPGEGEEYTRGTPNSWGPISADETLGLVYMPTGNATPDYWGSHRRDFDNRYSGSVLAINAETGALRWHFQTIHNDVWDMDVAAQPSLIDLEIDGKTVPALVQLTKRGQNFVLNRETGEPIYRVEEKPAPQGGAEPDYISKTQPYSVEMPEFSGMNPDKPFGVDEADMWGITPFDMMYCRIQFKKARWEGTLTPPGEDPVFFFPGSLGGNNWGSGSFDPERKILIANWNRVPMYLRLIPRPEADAMGLKAADGSPGTSVGGNVPQMGVPYAAGLAPFMSPLGAPCLAPPYGMVTAIDLTTKEVLWSRRSGTAEDSGVSVGGTKISAPLPIPMGVPGLGGTMTTKSGLVFVAASGEQTLRAMDLATGDVIWKDRLPAGGNATPMTYLSEESGRQFVVIAAGGHNLMQTQPGDYVVAYALPKGN